MKVRQQSDGGVAFWCPACDEAHCVNATWRFNGNVALPTIQPSLLVRSGHFITGHKGSCWCTWNAEHPDNTAPFKCFQCHSILTDGVLQFCVDSTHALAGRTVNLPDWPEGHE